MWSRFMKGIIEFGIWDLGVGGWGRTPPIHVSRSPHLAVSPSSTQRACRLGGAVVRLVGRLFGRKP